MGSNLGIDYEIQVAVENRRRAFRNNRSCGIFSNYARYAQSRTRRQVLTTINCRANFTAFEISLTPIVRLGRTPTVREGAALAYARAYDNADRAETCAHDLDNILLLRVAVAREMSAMESCGDVATRLFDLQLERLTFVARRERSRVTLL